MTSTHDTTEVISGAEYVIRKFGGIEATAEVIGRHRSVVNRWVLPKERGGTGGAVPGKHFAALLSAARQRGIDLVPEHLFATPATQSAA